MKKGEFCSGLHSDTLTNKGGELNVLEIAEKLLQNTVRYSGKGMQGAG
jgi:hypothetical protein